jgi:MFS family permease
VGVALLVSGHLRLRAGAAPSPTLLLARALVGGRGGVLGGHSSLLSDLYPAERRARVLAIFYAAIPVGSALGFIFGGSVGTALGWRSAFMIAGGPGLVFALALLLLREPRRGRYDPPGKASAPPPCDNRWPRCERGRATW